MKRETQSTWAVKVLLGAGRGKRSLSVRITACRVSSCRKVGKNG